MTRDDIIRMAKQAGIEHLPDNWQDGWWQADSTKSLERFAALVAAAEREACAKVCDLAVEANSYQGNHWTIGNCAKAIRARGEK